MLFLRHWLAGVLDDGAGVPVILPLWFLRFSLISRLAKSFISGIYDVNHFIIDRKANSRLSFSSVFSPLENYCFFVCTTYTFLWDRQPQRTAACVQLLKKKKNELTTDGYVFTYSFSSKCISQCH